MCEGPHEQSTLLAKHRRSYAAVETPQSVLENAGLMRTYINDATHSHSREQSPMNSGMSTCRLSFYLVEPMVMLLVFAYSLSSIILKSQIIYQTCVAICDYNATDCMLLGSKNASEETKRIETNVQPHAVVIFMTITLIKSIVPAVCGSFIGAWSDRFGRKPLLIAAYTGYSLSYVIASVIANLAAKAVVSPWYYLLSVLPETLLGGSVTYSVAAWCYISDVSSETERPYRMAIVEAAMYTGVMFGSLCAGYIYDVESVATVFAISAGIIAFALLIIICCVPESLRKHKSGAQMRSIAHLEPEFRTKSKSQSPITDSSPTSNPTSTQRGTKTATDFDHEDEAFALIDEDGEGSTFRNLFEWKRLQEMLETSFRPRNYSDRAIIWLIITALLIYAFVADGSITVFYLFVREQLQWGLKPYTTYETINTLVAIVGNLTGLLLLRKWLQISVLNLALLAFCSEVASCFMKGFVYTAWQLYAAIGAGFFKALGSPMCRTIITKIVPPSELGKVFSLKKVLEALMPFVAAPAYAVIYNVTLISFPGFFNLLSGNLLLLAIGCLLLILRKKQKNAAYYRTILD